MKLVPMMVSLVIAQSAFAGTEPIDLLNVTVDGDPAVSKLVVHVDSDSRVIKSGVFKDGTTQPPTFSPKDLTRGVVLKKMMIPVTVLRTPLSNEDDSIASNLSSFFGSEDSSKSGFNPAEGGSLELKILREGRILTRDYRKVSLNLTKTPQGHWALSSKVKGTLETFDAIHFVAMREKDLDKDLIASGLTLEAYCDKQSDDDFKLQKCIKRLNSEVGIKTLELTNDGKTVETLETKNLPGA